MPGTYSTNVFALVDAVSKASGRTRTAAPGNASPKNQNPKRQAVLDKGTY